MAGGSVQIDKLLHTCIEAKAADLFITVGSQPALKKSGRLRLLNTKVLDNDDTTALMKSITPERCQQELQEKGGTDFAISFVNNVRFRVAVFLATWQCRHRHAAYPQRVFVLRTDRHARGHSPLDRAATWSALGYRPYGFR